MQIADYLSRGRVNAVPLRYLVMMTGVEERSIRRMIEKERRAGTPILADNETGYFLPVNEMEKDRCVQSMRHRANEIMVTAEALAAASVEAGDR